jgi:hypothetical protein
MYISLRSHQAGTGSTDTIINRIKHRDTTLLAITRDITNNTRIITISSSTIKDTRHTLLLRGIKVAIPQIGRIRKDSRTRDEIMDGDRGGIGDIERS